MRAADVAALQVSVAAMTLDADGAGLRLLDGPSFQAFLELRVSDVRQAVRVIGQRGRLALDAVMPVQRARPAEDLLVHERRVVPEQAVQPEERGVVRQRIHLHLHENLEVRAGINILNLSRRDGRPVSERDDRPTLCAGNLIPSGANLPNDRALDIRQHLRAGALFGEVNIEGVRPARVQNHLHECLVAFGAEQIPFVPRLVGAALQRGVGHNAGQRAGNLGLLFHGARPDLVQDQSAGKRMPHAFVLEQYVVILLCIVEGIAAAPVAGSDSKRDPALPRPRPFLHGRLVGSGAQDRGAIRQNTGLQVVPELIVRREKFISSRIATVDEFGYGADDQLIEIALDPQRMAADGEEPHGLSRPLAAVRRGDGFRLGVERHAPRPAQRQEHPSVARVHEGDLLFPHEPAFGCVHEFADEVVQDSDAVFAAWKHGCSRLG